MLRKILNRMRPQAENITAEKQASFWKGRGTTEQIFNLQLICKKHFQHQRELYHVFIDFKKAFDKVWNLRMQWATLKKFNMGKKLIHTIKQLYTNTTSSVFTPHYHRGMVPLLYRSPKGLPPLTNSLQHLPQEDQEDHEQCPQGSCRRMQHWGKNHHKPWICLWCQWNSQKW